MLLLKWLYYLCFPISAMAALKSGRVWSLIHILKSVLPLFTYLASSMTCRWCGSAECNGFNSSYAYLLI